LLVPRSNEHFDPAELRQFLVEIDKRLKTRATLTLIGGGAAVLAYDVETATADLDTHEQDKKDLRLIQAAAKEVRAKRSLDIPIRETGVVILPDRYAERLERALPSLQKLRVLVLERHDLALSKIARSEERDMTHLDELHEKHPLELEVLVKRYLEEMKERPGNQQLLEDNLLYAVERLFGELSRERTRKKLLRARRRGRR
jgi:hypothetical protein